MLQKLSYLTGVLTLTLLTSSMTAPKSKPYIYWRDEGEPMVIVVRGRETPNCKYADGCFILNTIESAQFGLRSDGVVVWRHTDLSKLLTTPTTKGK